jgi:hypothetical protein
MTRLAPRTQRRILLGALLVASCLAAVLAISSLGSSSSPTILNTEKVEQAIADSSLAQRDAVAHVTCPAGVRQKAGVAFSCTAVANGVSTRFDVTQLDGSGHVHYEAR